MAARRLQSPLAVTHLPLPMLESGRSLIVLTMIGAPKAEVTAASVARASVDGLFCAAAPTDCRSATSRQPAPFGSASRSVLHTPNRRSSLHEAASAAASTDVTSPLWSTSSPAGAAVEA